MQTQFGNPKLGSLLRARDASLSDHNQTIQILEDDEL